MNTLKIKQLSKVYPNGVKALNHVSLEIGNGMYGLLGANGAGKSTLMRTIATLQNPTQGSVLFNGTDIAQTPQMIRTQLGYLPQEFGVYPKISAEKLLDHIAVLKGIQNKGARKNQVGLLLEQTNLYQHRKKSVHTFSGGMKQRFGIAQALLGDPKIIIVDEPTAGLDPEERNRFLNLLSAIGDNVVVILSTHIVEDVYNLCSKMAILAEGTIVEEGVPSQLTDSLDKKIWTKTIERSSFDDYDKAFTVLSSKLISGQTQISVLSLDQPETGFKAVKPILEDVYFNALNQYKNQTAHA